MKTLLTAAILASLIAFCYAPASAVDCIDVELGAELVAGNPLDGLSLFFSLQNCGSERDLARVAFSLEQDGSLLGSVETMRSLLPDREFRVELMLPVPAVVPPGSYRLCVTASIGDASDNSCATIVIGSNGQVIQFIADGALTPVEETTWGGIKSLYE